ncbi:MAG: DinB family protein, partial [Chloroflexota bacterium]
RYNASQQDKTKDLPPADLLEQYKQVRADSVQWVSGLKDEELEIKGRHPFLGETVIREMVKMLYLHNQLHYRDVKRAL